MDKLTQTTEGQLLMLFRDRMLPYAGQDGRNNVNLQKVIKNNGSDIVKALQNNHGHSLAASVSLMRMVLNGLNIK